MLLLAAMAIIVGSGGAAAACLLLKLIALVTNLAWFGRASTAPANIADAASGPMVIVIPVIGSIVIGLMARFGSEKIRGHGIPEAIEAILFGQSRLSAKVAVLKPLSSAISIGSGGPFGAEGPIIMTGGAIGSLFAQCFHLSAAERKTLLVAGAAAGMTAIFGTPVAAILLAVEVLLFEWKPRSLVPVIAAALAAFCWRPLLIGIGSLFPFTGSIVTGALPLVAAVGLGVIGGLLAAVLSSTLYRIEDLFHRLPVHWMWWPAMGAVVVGLGGLADPRVLGAGYNNIQDLLNGSVVGKALVLLLIVKACVWLVALGSGTSGGVLAPLLILGGALGALVATVLPGDTGFWALLGMAAVMSAGMRAPLTGAVFAIELTGRLDALPGTVAAAAASYAVAVLILRRSILTEKISRRGRHILQEYAVDPLAITQVGQIMTPDPVTLPAEMPAGAVTDFFAVDARHRSYPVVDGTSRAIGMVARADALRWQVTEPEGTATLGELLSNRSLPVVHPETPCSAVAELMVAEETGRVAVVDRQTGRLVGIVARRDLLQVRAEQRRDEHERVRFVQRSRRADAKA
ncbi:chloride channel protein [Sphingomonas sp. R1]|uniref:chloride channel protein n=1 Tax=Sphingomonas sp. R1 TaxID=399176 RepID=UPI002225485C|nr:chloride channel protein [Sphingomonas sp. R1]UYY79642.1 chloride channel protein [Sphingomonas sp. R1]